MKRRSTAGGNPVRTQRRRAVTPKRSNEPKAVSGRSFSAAGRETTVARLTRELKEALDQQAATADVLKVISRSTFDLQTVLDTLTESATRLCAADKGAIMQRAGNVFRLAANCGFAADFKQYSAEHPLPLDRGSMTGRAALEGRAIHVPDVLADPEYQAHGYRTFGYRTGLAVPLQREGTTIGTFTLTRDEVRPFNDKQIELVTTFADQAVIAIENARLLDELRDFQQQAATADVLKVISRSTFDLQTVLDTLTESAVRLCSADRGVIFQRDGDLFRFGANYGFSREVTQYSLEHPLRADRGSVTGRAALEGRAVHIPDVLADPEYRATGHQQAAGYRTNLGVPLLREGTTIGVFSLTRDAMNPFTEKQIELATTFADQALIAIENVRLFEAEQQRTRELGEALEQQTATADVLKIISRSTFDLQTVLDTLTESAARLCAAERGSINQRDGDGYRVIASYGYSPEAKQYFAEHPVPGSRATATGRAAQEGRTIHIPDVLADPEYHAAGLQGVLGHRTVLGVPLLRDRTAIGVFALTRNEVNPFTDKQIELVTTFADQAVIAIENARLLGELRESLEQQTATSDILASISGSLTDPRPVFNAIVHNLRRLFGARFATVQLLQGGTIEMPAADGEVATDKIMQHYPRPLDNTSVGGQAMLAKQIVQYAPVLDNPVVPAAAQQMARDYQYNSIIAAPMIRQDTVVGAIVCGNPEPRVFDEKEAALIKSFAAQAVIAIENTRLLSELRQRTDDLSELLEQQTATSEVLQVISSSPGDLQPVFEAMLANAARICGARIGGVYRRDGETVQLVATTPDLPAAYAAVAKPTPFRPNPRSFFGGLIVGKTTVQVRDFAADESFARRDPFVVAAVELGALRTALFVPMLRDNELIGFFAMARQEVRPFTDQQIELVQNFAAQAVIAIENTRLLSELRQRTDDLSESLEQQTATAELLEVINRSRGDLAAVFDGMLEKAMRVCGAAFGVLNTHDGTTFHTAAMRGVPAAYAQYRRDNPPAYGPGTGPMRILSGDRVVHVVDLMDHDAYRNREPNRRALVDLGSARTSLHIPLLRDQTVLGTIQIYRQEVRPFSDKEIALLQNFATQAVIAMENARLLDEIRQRTDELTRSVGELRALGEVSQAVNSTLELEIVLSTIVAKAVQLSNTDAGAIYVYDEAQREFHLRATYGMDQELIDALSGRHISVDETLIAAVMQRREPTQVPDLREEAANELNQITLRAGYRARLTAPLFRGEDIVGMLVVRRRTPGAFPQSTVDLIKTFAAQSVLTIQNARLFANVETRTRELAQSLADLRTAQNRLIQTEKLASLGQLTAGIAHEIKNPLNFVNNFSAVSSELIDELQEAVRGGQIDEKTRTEITELTDMLRGNLDKVVQHGKRADSIVKNMLLHSRQGSGEHQPADINAIIEESLNLAYHGARAEKQGFNITLERSFDPTVGKVDLFPQEITRVLLNLIANGFYATTKRKAQTDGGYEPTLSAATKNLGDRVEIRIRDNGTGIPPEVKEQMFNPFFTTKPAGEGTGLGLSLSHDIVVKQHSGSIEVDTGPGEFTEFRIVLPRNAAGSGQSGGSA